MNFCTIIRRRLISPRERPLPPTAHKHLLTDLATSGIPVALLAPGTSVPLKGTHGFRDATCDTTTITKWISSNSGANYCIPTGSASGLWALDIDMPDGFDELQNLWGDSIEIATQLAQTLLVRTPSGGCHLWMPAGNAALRSGKMPRHDHIEIKADNTGLTGPFSIRRASEKKLAGDYLPTTYNPEQQLWFLGFSKAVRREVQQRFAVSPQVSLPNSWLAKEYALERAKRISIDQTHHKPAMSARPLNGLEKEEAQRIITQQIQPLLSQFIEAPDGHDVLARDLMWKLAHFEKLAILTNSQREEILTKLERETLYANGSQRLTPYPIRGKWESTWRKLGTISTQQIEQTATTLWRDLDRARDATPAYAGEMQLQ